MGGDAIEIDRTELDEMQSIVRLPHIITSQNTYGDILRVSHDSRVLHFVASCCVPEWREGNSRPGSDNDHECRETRVKGGKLKKGTCPEQAGMEAVQQLDGRDDVHAHSKHARKRNGGLADPESRE